METYIIEKNIIVFGKVVKNFPQGIGEAFDALIKMISGKFDRDYYGISYMDKNGKMIYYAAAIEKYNGEAEKFNCEKLTVEKGKYICVTVKNWRQKTNSINTVFQEIMKNDKADKTKPAIEWYKNDDEMLCMVKLKPD